MVGERSSAQQWEQQLLVFFRESAWFEEQLRPPEQPIPGSLQGHWLPGWVLWLQQTGRSCSTPQELQLPSEVSLESSFPSYVEWLGWRGP